jgi:hypothetical protein
LPVPKSPLREARQIIDPARLRFAVFGVPKSNDLRTS